MSALHAAASLGRAYAALAEQHRTAAEGQFGEWITQARELTVAAERLLALEIELARGAGVTWVAIAGALGVSRQAAWKRFADVKPSA